MKARTAATAAVAGVLATVLTAGTAAHAATKPIDLKIGIVLPFTGDLSTYGPSLAKAAQMGVTMTNEAMKAAKVPGKCTVVGSEDDQTNAAAGVEAANKLVKTKKANILIGSMASSVTIAIATSVAIPGNIVIVSPTASDPSITDLKDNNTVWRVYPSDTLQANALVTAMGKAFGPTATVNVGARNDAFGTALTAIFKAKWTAGGGKIGQAVTWNPDAPTFDTEAQKLASGSPAGWLIVDFPDTLAKVGPALVRTGSWDPAKTFMTEALDSTDAIKKVGDEVMAGVRGTAATSDGAAKDAFKAEFVKRNPGVSFTGFEGTAFDTGVLTCLAGIRANSTKSDALKAALPLVSGPAGTKYTWQNLKGAVKDAAAKKPVAYYGAWAEVDFDAAGDPGSGVFNIWQYKDAKLSTIDTINYKG